MKSKSIRSRMFRIIGQIMAVVILFLGINVYGNRKMIHRLGQILDSQLFYTSYMTKLDELQNAVEGYFKQLDPDLKEEALASAAGFEQYSRELTDIFPDPQFQDNYYIVQSYLETVDSFLQLDLEDPTMLDEQFQSYQDAVRKYEIVSESYQTMAEPEQKIITERMDSYLNDWQKKESIFLILGIAVCAVAFFMGKRLTDHLTFPITALTERVNRIVQQNAGHPAAALHRFERCRETEILTNAFDQMMETIEKQMDELKEKIVIARKLHTLEIEHMQTKIVLCRTEMSLMQSMLSPHFLFNALTTMSSLAVIEEAPQTEEYSISLAKYLRKFLDFVGKTVAVSEELELLDQYIGIQKLRCGKRIDFEIFCEENCRDRKIPALILQPLVENSLSHGLKDCRQGGRIRICCRMEGEQLVLVEEDNGTGITDEKIAEIMANLGKPFESGERGIGLRSIAQRLKDQYGETAGVHLEHREPGVRIVIRIGAE